MVYSTLLPRGKRASLARSFKFANCRFGSEVERPPVNHEVDDPRLDYRDYSDNKKNPAPEDLWQFFQNGQEFFNQILHTYYAFPSTLDYEFLFN